MRVIGLILVLVGALTLGYESFELVIRHASNSREAAAAAGRAWYVPPVVGGIVLVGGLLVLATSPRWEET